MMILLIWELLCAALLWSVFCRLVRTRRSTRLDVRIALVAVGAAALLGLGAPVYGWLPDGVTLAIVGAVALLQIVMSHHWRKGVPRQFVYPHHQPKNRQGDAA